MTVTKILGEQAGIQYQGVIDKSEADPRDSLANSLFVGEFKNGPYNKPFKVTAANIRGKLGFDPESLQYQAIEDLLKQGVPFIWVMRVNAAAGGPGKVPANATSVASIFLFYKESSAEIVDVEQIAAAGQFTANDSKFTFMDVQPDNVAIPFFALEEDVTSGVFVPMGYENLLGGGYLLRNITSKPIYLTMDFTAGNENSDVVVLKADNNPTYQQDSDLRVLSVWLAAAENSGGGEIPDNGGSTGPITCAGATDTVFLKGLPVGYDLELNDNTYNTEGNVFAYLYSEFSYGGGPLEVNSDNDGYTGLHLVNHIEENIRIRLIPLPGTPKYTKLTSQANSSILVDQNGVISFCLAPGEALVEPPATGINLPTRVAPFGPGGITELVNFYPINKLSNNSEYTLAIELDTTNLEPGDRVLLWSDDYLNDSHSMFYEFAPRPVILTADHLAAGVVYEKFLTTKYVLNYSEVAFTESGFLSIQIIKQNNVDKTEIGTYRFTQTLPLHLRADTAWGNQAEITYGLVGSNPYITPIYSVRASLENGPTSFRLDDGSDYDLSSDGAWKGAKRWDTWAHQNKVYFEYQMIALSQSDGELPLFGSPARLPFVGISERDIGTGMSYDDNVSINEWPYGIYVAKDGFIYHGNSSPQAFAGRDIVSGDVIGVLIDRDASTATFSLNGQNLYVGPLTRRNLYITSQSRPDATSATPSIFTTGGLSEIGLSLYTPTWLYGQSDYQEFK